MAQVSCSESPSARQPLKDITQYANQIEATTPVEQLKPHLGVVEDSLDVAESPADDRDTFSCKDRTYLAPLSHSVVEMVEAVEVGAERNASLQSPQIFVIADDDDADQARQLTTLEQVVQMKVDAAQVDRIEKTTQMQAAMSRIQSQMTAIDQNLHEKVGREQFQQLKSSFSMMIAQILSTIEHSSQDQARQLCVLEQVVQMKADAAQVDRIDESLTSIMEEKIPNIEGSITAMGEQMQGIDQDLHDRVTLSQFESRMQDESLTSIMEEKIPNIEGSVTALRGAIRGIDHQFAQAQASFVGLEAKVETLETKVVTLETKVETLKTQEKAGIGKMLQALLAILSLAALAMLALPTTPTATTHEPTIPEESIRALLAIARSDPFEL